MYVTKGRDLMSYTSPEVKNRYMKKTYTRITIIPKKEEAILIKQFCQDKGFTMNNMILQAVREYIEKYKGD